jgi:hypothetical protein
LGPYFIINHILRCMPRPAQISKFDYINLKSNDNLISADIRSAFLPG